MPSQLFVFSAPSGAGKSTIVTALINRLEGLRYSISHTSRKPRNTESDGTDYHFVTADAFSRMVEAGAFVEWARVYDDFYGTSFSSLNEQISSGLDVLLDIDAQGAGNIRKHFENAVLIYILPPSLEILKKRLTQRRTDDEDVIRARMKKASSDIRNCVWYNYMIINDDLEKAIEEAQSIIISERCRTARRLPNVKKVFDIS